MGQYSATWWFANDDLAANQRAAVFEEDQNTYAAIFSDPAMTIPLANPTTTDASGVLTFYAADGSYWIFVGKVGTGDSVLATIGANPDNPVLSVNSQLPDGGGNVTLTAADVGAQPIATINAKGDLYAGTADNTITRQAVGADGEVLTADSTQPTGMKWAPGGGGGAVDSVNGQTGVVVLDAGDVGADPAGSAAAVQALALLKANNLSDLPNPATARTSLGLGTAAVADTGVGATNVILGNDARLTDARTPTAHASTHAAAGSDPVTLAQLQVTNLTTDLAAKQPLDADLTQIASLTPTDDDILQRKGGLWVGRSVVQYKADLAYTAAQVGAPALSTLTTKGDLYVATGAGTVARRGVGSDGQVLTADSAQTDGVKWATPSSGGALPMAVVPRAAFIQAGGAAVVRSSKTATLNAMFLIPVALLSAATLSTITFEVTASIGSALVRLGIYNADASTYLPTGSPLVDFGQFTADTASTAGRPCTVSQALSAALYYIAIVGQGVAPTLRHCAGFNPYVSSASYPGGTGAGWDNAYVQTSVSGALPPIGSLTDTDSPVVGLKF